MTRTRRPPGRRGPGPEGREALGRSRGGLTTKVHLLADSGCRPLARVTSAGQRHDSLAFIPLMGRLKIARRGPGRPRTRPGQVLAGKAYSQQGDPRSPAATRHQGHHPRTRGPGDAPPPPARRPRRAATRIDPIAYKQRNTVERAFRRLRQHRAVATRYDKRNFVYRGTVDVAAIRIWLRDSIP